MIDALLLTLLPHTLGSLPVALSAPRPAPPAPPAAARWEGSRQDDEPWVEPIRAAGRDLSRLVALGQRYTAEEQEAAARAAYARVLEIDPDHEGAHDALKHHAYDQRWFETYAALSAYRREEGRRMLADHGLVRWNEEWVSQEDLVFLRLGWSRSDGDRWLRPGEAERLARETELLAAGWQQQDLTWIHPDEFDKWRAGMWKVGEEWMTKEAADAHHADLDHWWRVPSEGGRFVCLTTCDRDTASWIGWYADHTLADLARIFGLEPDAPLEVVVLRDLEQYNLFAAGDATGARPPAEAGGHSSVHYAFFADAWFDVGIQPPQYRGAGVAFWDRSSATLEAFGQHAVRHAAAHSYVEAIDPSWNTISALLRRGAGTFDSAAFWGEKRVPRWLRYGAASYVERFFVDDTVGEGGNPLWARTWAFENLRASGGLGEPEDVFALQLDPADTEGSGRLIHRAGLLVAFMLDGKCAPVSAAHEAFRDALRSGDDTAPAAQALQQALGEHRAEIEAFAGL